MTQSVAPPQLSKAAQALADQFWLRPHRSGRFLGEAGFFDAQEIEDMAKAVIEAYLCDQ